VNNEYWNQVRIYVARQAARWNCGSEGRLLFENLVGSDEWLQRLLDLAPEGCELSMPPASAAAAVVTNYFSQSI
jgi:hypothetical protein